MLKKLIEQRAKLYAAIIEKREALSGKQASAEDQAAWDKLMAEYRDVEAQIIIEERRIQMERENSVNNDAERESRARGEREVEIFRSILLEGRAALASLTREERENISGVNGANLMPTLIADRIEKAIIAQGGMMGACDVIRTTGGEKLGFPTINDTSSKAEIVGEYAQGSRSNTINFGKVELGAFSYRTKLVPISYELLQDSKFDIESLIVDLLSDQFVRGMNDHFTNAAYNATTTPRGIVSAAFGVNAAHDYLTADDLLNLMKGTNAAYWRNAKWMFNAVTLVEVMKLKDQDGRFIWQPDMANGARATIFGHEYVLNADMADIGAGKAPVLFGDFKKYKIRLVRGIQYHRLEELLAEWASIGIFGFARADGALVDAGTHPVSKLVLAAGSGRAVPVTVSNL